VTIVVAVVVVVAVGTVAAVLAAYGNSSSMNHQLAEVYQLQCHYHHQLSTINDLHRHHRCLVHL